MRKWALPLTVLGVGSVGALLLSERGRKAIGWIFARLQEAPDQIAGWNETAQQEIQSIQNALNDLSESLQVKTVQR